MANSSCDRVKLKVSLEIQECHHISVSRACSITELKNDVIDAFPILSQLRNNCHVVLKWLDSDNDWVNLETDVDLQNALQSEVSPLKLQVKVIIKYEDPAKAPTVLNANLTMTQHDPALSHAREDMHTFVKGQPDDSFGPKSFDSQPNSGELLGQQPSDSSLHSTTSDQYDGMYSMDYPSSAHQWPNEETCSLSRIQQIPLKRHTSVPRDDAYQMKALGESNRGRVVIINNKRFDNLGPLDGTDTDSTCISEVFKKLHYTVKPYSNKTSKEIQKVLNDEYIHLLKYGNQYDVFILILLTRCEDNYVYGKDGSRDLQFWQILEGFNTVPSLKGKPKIFLAEGCGKVSNPNSETGKADIILRKACNTSALPIGVNQRNTLVPGVGGRDETDAAPYQADIEDTLFYCGYTFGAGAPKVKGSLMLQALKDVLLSSGGDCSLKEMIPVAEEMIKMGAVNTEREFSMPEVIKDTLQKELFFM